MLRGTYKNAGNYSNNQDGKVFNSGYRERNFNGNIGINKKWGYSHLIFSSFNQSLGLIEGDRDSLSGNFLKQVRLNDTTAGTEIVSNHDLMSRQSFLPNQDIVHNKIVLDNTFILGKSRLSLLLAYQHNTRKEFGDVLNPKEAGIYLSLQTYSYDLKFFLPEKNNWQFTLGTNGMIQGNKNLGTEVIIPEYRQKDAGVFIYFKKEFNAKLNMAGGLRFDRRNYSTEELLEDSSLRFSSLNKSLGNISGSIGSTYELNKKIVIKANIARGYRAPQVAELSSNGRHEGTYRYEIGNRDLKPETSLQGDLGILFNSEHVSLDMAFFSNNINNFI